MKKKTWPARWVDDDCKTNLFHIRVNEWLLDWGHGVVNVVLAVLDHLHQDGGLDIWEGNLLALASAGTAGGTALVFNTTDHGLDQLGHHGHLAIDLKAVTL